jgi:predicted enzyme related to lactoylglutathione lyase
MYNRLMLNLNSVMLSSHQPKVLAEFYEKVFQKPADMVDGSWYGWQVNSSFFGVGDHSDIKGLALEPARFMFNFETVDVKAEFERIKLAGAKIIKAPYELPGAWIATLSDPDGNYFQLMTPWKVPN